MITMYKADGSPILISDSLLSDYMSKGFLKDIPLNIINPEPQESVKQEAVKQDPIKEVALEKEIQIEEQVSTLESVSEEVTSEKEISEEPQEVSNTQPATGKKAKKWT